MINCPYVNTSEYPNKIGTILFKIMNAFNYFKGKSPNWKTVAVDDF